MGGVGVGVGNCGSGEPRDIFLYCSNFPRQRLQQMTRWHIQASAGFQSWGAPKTLRRGGSHLPLPLVLQAASFQCDFDLVTCLLSPDLIWSLHRWEDSIHNVDVKSWEEAVPAETAWFKHAVEKLACCRFKGQLPHLGLVLAPSHSHSLPNSIGTHILWLIETFWNLLP